MTLIFLREQRHARKIKVFNRALYKQSKAQNQGKASKGKEIKN